MAPVIESFGSPVREQGNPPLLGAACTLNPCTGPPNQLWFACPSCGVGGDLAKEEIVPGKKD